MMASRIRHRWLALAALLCVAGPAAAQDNKTVGKRDGAAFAPVPNQGGNAALFVGVNEFAEDASLRTLNFAVNDAVALAHLFVLELQLVPPGRTVLALAGAPAGEEAAKQLDALKKAGVRVEPATKARVFRLLQDVAGQPRAAEDFLIVGFSSHGFEEGGVPYAMPADGVKAALADTAINLLSVEQKLAASKAGKRLLLLDACREKPLAGAKGAGAAMSPVFKEALARAGGQAVLASCDEGQYSWEYGAARQGVFTYFVLEALRGRARPDAQGLIRVDQLAEYVAAEVEAWSRKNVPHVQQPWFKGPQIARQIPLAVDPKASELVQRRLAALRQLAIDEKISVERLNEARRLLTGGARDENDRKRLALYERLADGKTDVETAEIALNALPMSANPPPKPESDRTPQPPAGAGGKTLTLDLGGGVTMELVRIEPGEFLMGSPDNEKDRDSDEGPQHRVKISRPFYMGKYEVTQKQWRAVMGSDPSNFKGDDLPVEMISWDDCQEFCRRLSQKVGQMVRLPTEAEWEYACRAGTTTRYGFGDADAVLGEYAWFGENSGMQTHPVGQKKPNTWGLYDMHGNVWEWCQDWHAIKYPDGGDQINPTGPGSGSARVCRGGSWTDDRWFLRAADRDRTWPDDRLKNLGLRVVVSASAAGAP